MIRSDIELIMMIEPLRWRFIAGITACESAIEPKRLTSNVARQSSRLALSTGTYLPPRNALFTSTSMRPNASRAAAASFDASSACAISVGTATARRPSARISVASDSSAAAVRAARTTSAPSRAKARAISRPIPGPIPETMPTLPASNMRVLLLVAHERGDVRGECGELLEQLCARARREPHRDVAHAERRERTERLGKLGWAPAARALRHRECRPADVQEPRAAADVDRRAGPMAGAMGADELDRGSHALRGHALRNPAVAARGRALECRARRSPDPDRWPWLLHRPRPQTEVPHWEEGAFVGGILVGQGAGEEIDALVEPPPARGHVD